MKTKPTGPAAANPTELEQLRGEVATLRAELALLRKFLHVSTPDEGEPGEPSLMISCSGIVLSHHETPTKHQAVFLTGDDGACLSFWGPDEKSRLSLEVDKEGARCRLMGKDLKEAAELRADEASGRGQIAVFDTGNPRALLKAMDNGGGSVSAVHDDGTTRACMTSTAHQGGGFMAVTPDMQVGVKITGDTPDGGAIIVNRHNGKPAVVVAATPAGGGILTFDPKGKMMGSVPQLPPEETDRPDET